MGLILTKKRVVQPEVPGPVIHDCYKHYELQISKVGKIVFTCDGCKMNGVGPRYVCTFCGNTLHRECKFPNSTISPHYFNGSIFTFTQTPELELDANHAPVIIPCAACHEPVCGFSYHCNVRNLILHPACSKLDKKIVFGDKILNLCIDPPLAVNCRRCQMILENGLFYVSSCKQNHFHPNCLVEMMHDFYTLKVSKLLHYMEHGYDQISSTTINKAETPQVDLSSIIVSKIESENGCTPQKVFAYYLTDGVDTNSPVKEDTTTSEPAKDGIFRRISNFFKTMYHKVLSGVTICAQNVWTAATSFSFKLTLDWCDKIAHFINLTYEFSKAILPYLTEGGSDISKEILPELSKAFNLNFSTEQCQKIQELLQVALKIFSRPIPNAFG